MKEVQQLISRQVGRWQMDRKIYLEELEHDLSISHPASAKPIVTVSRQQGCRGHEFGKILAHELHYGMFDKQIVEYIAEHLGVCSELVESLDEKDRSLLEQWVDGILRWQMVGPDDYIRGLIEVIKTVDLQGGLVILGRGANYLLKDSKAFHVRLVASLETRIRNIVEIDGISEEKAKELIEKNDTERKNYIKRYFKADIDNPLDYDVVINMDRNHLDPAVKIVLTCLRARGFSVQDTGGDKRKRD